MRFLKPLLLAGLVLAAPAGAGAQQPLNDLEMAHVAVTANNTDIAYAHLALAFSENEAIRAFAEAMIRDHSAVNDRIYALARQLGVEARDNAVSRQLRQDAERIKGELAQRRGAEFDRYYAQNELRYHRSVNGLVGDTFIPNIRNPEVKQAFETALTIFLGHERHAEQLVGQVVATRP